MGKCSKYIFGLQKIPENAIFIFSVIEFHLISRSPTTKFHSILGSPTTKFHSTSGSPTTKFHSILRSLTTALESSWWVRQSRSLAKRAWLKENSLLLNVHYAATKMPPNLKSPNTWRTNTQTLIFARSVINVSTVRSPWKDIWLLNTSNVKNVPKILQPKTTWISTWLNST